MEVLYNVSSFIFIVIIFNYCIKYNQLIIIFKLTETLLRICNVLQSINSRFNSAGNSRTHDSYGPNTVGIF